MDSDWRWRVNPAYGESIVCKGYTITRHKDYADVWTSGFFFSAWSPKQREALGYFNTADEAKAACIEG